MKEFTYTIKDPLGIHARPAGMLVKLVKTFPGTAITMTCGAKTVKMSSPIMIMSLGVKSGMEITVKAEGEAENAAAEALQKFLSENL